jgi:hypothetical protein
MKNVLVIAFATLVSQNLFAAAFECKNTYSDDTTVKLSVEEVSGGFLKNVSVFANVSGYTATNEVFPLAKYDPTYKPRNEKNAAYVRYLILKNETTSTSYELHMPKVINSHEFHAVWVVEHEGYHLETGYHQLTCQY